MVLRAPSGGGIHAPEHHCESNEAIFAHMPGLRVVMPSSPQRAYGLLLAAIRDPDPVIFLEPTRIYRAVKQEVADDGAALPLDTCFVLREGRDLTLITWGAMVKETLAAAEALGREAVSAEVIDVATLKPLDAETILASIEKTGRCVIVHEAPLTGGFGAEIAARIAESRPPVAAGADRAGHWLGHGHAPAAAGASLSARARPAFWRRPGACWPSPEAAANRLQRDPAMKTFNLPDLGEGLQEAEIVSWHVSPGDHVVADQPLVSVETDKAVVEVPSPRAGRVAELFGAAGDIVQVGAPLVAFEDRAPAAIPAPWSARSGRPRNAPRRRPSPGGAGRGSSVKATPAVRALARRLGVDLALVTPTSPDGVISAKDVEEAAEGLVEAGPLEPLRGVRRAMALRMAHAHAEVVPATVIDEADVDSWVNGHDVTIRLVRAIVAGCAEEPALNAWYDAQGQGRRLHAKVDLGIAVDTPDGLFVPVLRDVAKRAPADLRRGLERMKADIRARTIPPEELKGATITLSNFGTLAGRYAAPVVVPPQVAILSTGRIEPRPVVVDGPARGSPDRSPVPDLRPPGRDRWRGGAVPGGRDRRSRAAAVIPEAAGWQALRGARGRWPECDGGRQDLRTGMVGRQVAGLDRVTVEPARRGACRVTRRCRRIVRTVDWLAR